MKKIRMLPMLAAIAGLVLAVGTSAFKKTERKKNKENFTTLYFRYSPPPPPNSYSEERLETPENWTEVFSPTDGTNCGGSSDPCIVPIESTHLSGIGTNVQQFAVKLAGMTTPTPYNPAGTSYTSAVQYTAGVATAKKN